MAQFHTLEFLLHHGYGAILLALLRWWTSCNCSLYAHTLIKLFYTASGVNQPKISFK